MLHYFTVLGFLSAEQLDRLEIQDVQMTGFHKKYVFNILYSLGLLIVSELCVLFDLTCL